MTCEHHLSFALRYAKFGWLVFPVHSMRDSACTCGSKTCGSPAKHPQTRHGLKDATTDPKQITDWWSRSPESNIGVRTGENSGIVVVDIDPRHGGDKSMEELMERFGSIPETVESVTGGGGRHLVFQHPCRPISNRANVLPGIDLRGDDGYIVAPPSSHASGNPYAWKDGHDPFNRQPIPMPAWLLELVETRQSTNDIGRVAVSADDAHCERDRLTEDATLYIAGVRGVSEGERNSTAFSVAGHLASFETDENGFHLSETQILDLVRTWNHKNRPELLDAELFSVVHSAMRNGTPRKAHVVQLNRRRPDDSGVSPIWTAQWPDTLGEAAFHGLAGEFVRAIEEHTEADPAALLIDFLVSFGNLIGRKSFFVADGAKHCCNLFAVLVGNTSKGRKGTSRAHIARLFAELPDSWTAERVQAGLSSGEGLIWAVRDPILKREPVRENRRPTGEYDEVETDGGVPDKRLLVIEAEFASTLRVLGRDGNTLSPLLRQAWDTGDLRILTKNSPAVATGGHISVIGHITRDELRRFLTATEAANGFGNRFLWICVRRSKVLPEGGKFHEVDIRDLIRRLDEARFFGEGEREVRRDDEARQHWAKVYTDLSEGQPGLFGAVTSRAEAQVMRLALIYALLDQSPTIRIDHLRAARCLWTYAEQSARFIFGDSVGDPIADELLKSLQRAGSDGMTRTEIRDLFGRHRKSEQVNRALRVLLQQGSVRCKREKTDGRPTERWFAVMPNATEATKAT